MADLHPGSRLRRGPDQILPRLRLMSCRCSRSYISESPLGQCHDPDDDEDPGDTESRNIDIGIDVELLFVVDAASHVPKHPEDPGQHDHVQQSDQVEEPGRDDSADRPPAVSYSEPGSTTASKTAPAARVIPIPTATTIVEWRRRRRTQIPEGVCRLPSDCGSCRRCKRCDPLTR